MKNLIVASAAALLIGTCVVDVGAARAEILDDSYVSILGGPTFAPSLNVNGTKRAVDTGYNVGARYGHYLDSWGLPNVSAEADFLFSQSDYSNVPNARLQSSSYMGNLVYHLPTSSGLQLYGGGGAGAVNTNIDNGLGNHGGSTVFGWQLIGGVEYRASEQASLFAEYRYQNAHDANAGGFTRVGNTGNHLSLGVKWHLD